MITSIPFRDIPRFQNNKVFLDFIEGKESVSRFFQYSPLDFPAALAARKNVPVNRNQAADALSELNRTLGAHQEGLANIEALRDPAAFCVITGQQVGFFGGPVFTAYKILTTIRLARELTDTLGVRCVPVFWGASEDHDFFEINHVNVMKQDGEVGKVSFSWSHKGNSIYDIPLDDHVRRKVKGYIRQLKHDLPHCGDVADIFRPRRESSFTQWTYTLLSRLFSHHGLVIADPRIFRPHMGGLFREMLDKREDIKLAIQEAGEKMRAAGYSPALDPRRAGRLYTYDKGGKRIRFEESTEKDQSVSRHPERFSPDVALRPLFADAALPVIVSVLGPGEIAYTAQLQGLYDVLNLPQPLIFPRKSFTLMSDREADRLALYGTDISHILTNRGSTGDIFQDHFDEEGRSLFQEAGKGLHSSFLPLKEYLAVIDPNLEKTWHRALDHSNFQLNKLQERAIKARLSRSGLSGKELQFLRNTILPRGQLQERILPLPHFIGAFGADFLDTGLTDVSVTDFSHHAVTISQ